MAEDLVKVDEVLRKLDLADRRVRAGAARGLRDAGEDLLTESKHMVPLDEGTLMESGTVDPPVGVDERAGEMQVIVGYNLVYAARRHEEKKAVISRAQEGRSAKFLEKPAKQNARRYAGHIAGEVKKALG